MTFISETEAKPLFPPSCLFGGIGLFYIGMVIANHYNRIAISKMVIACFATTTVVGFLVTIAQPTFAAFTLTTALVTLLNADVLTTFMMKHN